MDLARIARRTDIELPNRVKASCTLVDRIQSSVAPKERAEPSWVKELEASGCVHQERDQAGTRKQ